MRPVGLWYWFDGRVPRSTFWVCSIGLGLLGMVWAFLLLADLPLLLYLVGAVVLFYFTLVVSIKRWHDRNKSAWWMFIYFIPLIGPFWILIELGFLAGTNGPNRYGLDPREE